jgi:hypothetical protein
MSKHASQKVRKVPEGDIQAAVAVIRQSERVLAAAIFKNYAASELMINCACETLLAVFAGGLFKFALERSVRQFIDVHYSAQIGGVYFNALGGHGPGPVANRRA